MPYKTTADLLNARDMSKDSIKGVTPLDMWSNPSGTYNSNSPRQTPPSFTGDYQPNPQRVANAARISADIAVKQRMSLSGIKDLGQKTSASGLNRLGTNNFSQPNQVKPITSTQDPNADFLNLNKGLSDIDLSYRTKIEDATLQSNINRIKKYEPLANNEANRAYGMKLDNENRALGNQLATQFPYKKYETESSSAREIMNSSLGAIPTFLNRATASRLSPVSMSL